ncbi:MAG: hypothetical protein IPH26_03520 [Sterolibacteriaceae bacterium]|uniref:Uncharacterized protein n=1 Tax=Candidatus Methylophosphatis roskildensis TaxID=2899263 RepID=A0A9D7E1B6_9PROT|nr:hypothetical protein [Candidatus Methylophosphatis roskildensis]
MLDIGLTDSTLRGLLRLTGNPRMVWDSYPPGLIAVCRSSATGGPGAVSCRARCGDGSGACRTTAELDFQSLGALARDYLILAFRIADPRPFRRIRSTRSGRRSLQYSIRG